LLSFLGVRRDEAAEIQGAAGEENELVRQSHELLKTSLKLPDIQELKPTYYDHNSTFHNFILPTAELKNRFDASYHQPIVNSIISIIRKNAESLVDLSNKQFVKKIILPGRFKRVYVKEGHGRVFIGGKQLYELDPGNFFP
jgi:type I restriction enzyme, S subunit